jgi:propanol-preferring alcohol dehydrogenase
MEPPEIPIKHKALVYDSPGNVSAKVEYVDTPRPGNGEVLVKLTHSGVCHSDMAHHDESVDRENSTNTQGSNWGT